MAKSIQCIGCSANVPDTECPTHKYLGASPGCWKIFGDILAKEYGDPEYMKAHRLTVDAYALQHVGVKSPQTTQSMNVHLISLCAALLHNIEYDFIPKIMNDRIKKYKGIFTWLTPPESLGDMIVVNVAKAKTPDEHDNLVHSWAKSVWKAWSKYHKTAEDYFQNLK